MGEITVSVPQNVTYADERKEERPVAGSLTIRIGTAS